MKRSLIATLLAGGLVALAMPAQEGKIAERKEDQQKRIGNGVKSGELTASETTRLEKKEANLNKEVRKDRKTNDGKLTASEKKQINRQQNKVSNDIYKDKHNGAVQQQ